MAKPKSLLEPVIQESIKKVRYQKPQPKRQKQSLFYLIVVFLVTLSVILSLLRYF